MVIESMKLETAIKAWRDGTVAAVHVGVGQTFERGAPLVTLAPGVRESERCGGSKARLDTASEEFRLNWAHNRGLADTLKERQRAARRERPARDLERLTRQNKMFVRDRIELLLDPGTPFLELSTLAANTGL